MITYVFLLQPKAHKGLLTRLNRAVWALSLSSICLIMTPNAAAQALPDPTNELQRQQQQLSDLRQKLEPSTNTRLQSEATVQFKKLPTKEAPCIQIKHVDLNGALPKFGAIAKALNGPQGDDAPQGKCLGAEGIQILIDRVQNALIAQGFITARVHAPAQDLKTGTLVLNIFPGYLGQNRFTDPNAPFPTNLRNAFPAKSGDLLSLRDIEQGLDNLRQIPSADADIQIAPAEQDLYSDVVVAYRQSRPLRLIVSADNAGSDATGKYQSSSTFFVDNPLKLNDLLYLSVQHDLGGGEPESKGPRGSRGAVLHYDVPWGYWRLGLTVNASRYYQTIEGAFQSYRYSGESAGQELQVERVIARNAVSKTTISLKGFGRRSSNFIDDTEVEVQRRRTGGWELEAGHRHYLGDATIDARLAYRRGTGLFGAIAAPEELFDEGTSRSKISTLYLSLYLPLAVRTQRLVYSSQLRLQDSATLLTPQDRLCLGGRYTVRGSDGQQSVCGDRGGVWRNELNTTLGKSTPRVALQAYGGVDAGYVSGFSQPHRALQGAFAGVRGSVQQFSFDVFAATPLRQPERFDTPSRTYGIALNATF
jgi:hemolysin activation/secretion protein